MKKLITLAAMLFVALGSFAQQALWGGQQIISPEINADNSVTFRFVAPKAIKVQVTGDFLPTQHMEVEFNGRKTSKRVRVAFGATLPSPLPASSTTTTSLLMAFRLRTPTTPTSSATSPT